MNQDANFIDTRLAIQRAQMDRLLWKISQELELDEGQLVVDSTLDTEITFWKDNNPTHLRIFDFNSQEELTNHIKELNK